MLGIADHLFRQQCWDFYGGNDLSGEWQGVFQSVRARRDPIMQDRHRSPLPLGRRSSFVSRESPLILNFRDRDSLTCLRPTAFCVLCIADFLESSE